MWISTGNYRATNGPLYWWIIMAEHNHTIIVVPAVPPAPPPEVPRRLPSASDVATVLTALAALVGALAAAAPHVLKLLGK